MASPLLKLSTELTWCDDISSEYMTLETNDRAWDFTPVIDLINSLSFRQAVSKQEEQDAAEKWRTDLDGEEEQPTDVKTSLGDFRKIWDFLGVSRDVPPSSPSSVDTARLFEPAQQDEYASDGAIYTPAPLKGVRWEDELNRICLDGYAEDTASPEEDGIRDHIPESQPAAPKSKRKRGRNKNKKNCKTEQQEQGHTKNTGIQHGRSVSDLESETGSQHSKNAPARKASLHPLTAQNGSNGAHRNNLRSRGDPSTPKPISNNVSHALAPPAAVLGNKLDHSRASHNLTPVAAPLLYRGLPNGFTQPKTPMPPYMNGLPQHAQTVPGKQPSLNRLPQPPSQSLRNNLQNQSLNASSQAFIRFIPAPQNQPMQSFVPVANGQQRPLALHSNQTQRGIEPLIPRSIVDRNLALFNKLFAQFPDDRAWLVSPVALSNHSTSPTGIHVFVDFSNIVIGFMEHLKKQRGIPNKAHVPRVNISFHALVLMMERRRPVAKRVLCGSTPYIEAFDDAKEIGYETNILDKVLKAKELTDRQKYFQELDNRIRSRRQRKSLNNTSNQATPTKVVASSLNNIPNQATPTKVVESYGYSSILPAQSGSSSDSNGSNSTPQHSDGKVFAPEKWVEQAVDEILHLKMLESLVDYSQPSTMVLATGDAAEAEYSDGFLAMAERALKKGWKVELIAWGKSVSLAWRKLEWSMWRKEGLGKENVTEARMANMQFRIVELDDFAEELLNM